MRHYQHLNIHEREQIRLLFSQGQSLRTIGERLGRDHRTIGRELARNSSSLGKSSYCPSNAQRRSVKRRVTCRSKKLESGTLRSYVVRRLIYGWSPETINGRLKQSKSKVNASPETIYQFIYDQPNKKERYWEFLHYSHKRRQSWQGRKSQTAKRLLIPNRINISFRPQEANHRERVGHLEGDLTEGKKSTGGAVSVTVDRRSGLVLLDKLRSKQSKERIETLIRRLRRYSPALSRTITFDNGTENFEHEKLISELGCQTYFCNPYHAWEKGTVENTIGLIRSWIPKGTDLTTITKDDLTLIAYELNNRPRKRLGFLTPFELVLQELNRGTSS